eukprot:1489202-Prymnesium_polylepis.1
MLDSAFRSEKADRWTQTLLDGWVGIAGTPAAAPPYPKRPRPVPEQPPAEAASFCETCSMHFHAADVQWPWSDGAPERFFQVETKCRLGFGELYTTYSACVRCREHFPRGEVLWKWAALRLKARAVCEYWLRCVHAPRYVPRLLAEAAADLPGFV